MKPTIGIDVDGTLYTPWEVANQEAFRLAGVQPFHLPWESYDTLRIQFGNEIANQAFALACSPERIPTREIYPDCSWAIRQLQIQGYNVAFISHNHAPDEMVGPITKWLRQNFGSKVKVSILRHDESKVDLLKAIGGIALIDDKPDVALDVHEEGLISIMPRHPYNVYAEQYGVTAFDPQTEWKHVPILFELRVQKFIEKIKEKPLR